LLNKHIPRARGKLDHNFLGARWKKERAPSQGKKVYLGRCAI